MKGLQSMKSLDFKFMNLKRAYSKLSEVAKRYDGVDDILRDSLIQRFEFTYELCHKTLLEFMKYEGIAMTDSFPRTVFKKAYANDFISDDILWIQLMEDRNSTSHIYNENIADEVAGRIKDVYVSAIGELIDNMEVYIG